ncbi:hypothetical protein M231_02260 [Tremella mesenterica]|uniref:Uncharacterized protein n=1 Tax=Tremella mesenterica TaxID=5217 RepID=A0A4V1M4H9_TREME|nr:hypothetical protein M231_02260 [Tremella mesenterica]
MLRLSRGMLKILGLLTSSLLLLSLSKFSGSNEDDLPFLYDGSGTMAGMFKYFKPLVSTQEPSPERDRWQSIAKLKALQILLKDIYPAEGLTSGRSWNEPTIDRLIACLTENTCEKGQETLIILQSPHFLNAQRGLTSGEDIWAASSLEAFQSLNYTLVYTFGVLDTVLVYQTIPDLVTSIWWASADFLKCLQCNDENYQSTEKPFGAGRQTGTKGCPKKEGFEDGIPVWKSWIFHFWQDPRHPLGHGWTLAPEDYAKWKPGKEQNRYLGYSIESRCRSQKHFSPEEREHCAVALGKLPSYFDPDQKTFTWTNQLDLLVHAMPRGSDRKQFEIIAFAGPTDENTAMGVTLNTSGVVNYGKKPMAEWNSVVARSKLLLGVGRPFTSPSLRDILGPNGRPEKAKTEIMKAHAGSIRRAMLRSTIHQSDTQVGQSKSGRSKQVGHAAQQPQEHITSHQGDGNELQAAVLSALTNPIKRYIPPAMGLAAVRERHKQIIESDWEAEALLAVDRLYTSKGEKFDFLL